MARGTQRKKPGSTKRKPTKRSSRRRFIVFLAAHGLLWGALALAGYWMWLDRQVADEFLARQWNLPARVFATPVSLYVGQSLSTALLQEHLATLGYRRVASNSATELKPGHFQVQAGAVQIQTRGFSFPDGIERPTRLDVRFANGIVTDLGDDGVAIARLEPVEIGRIHPGVFEDRRLLVLDEVPRVFLDTLLAVEDRRYHQHFGVDLIGIARAFVRNLLAGRITQGGSTITQQLVKNLFLSPERSYWRKFNEVLMAISLERRFGKDAILETYLNEIFLGQDGNRAIHGFGLAAEHYFARPLSELDVPEIAMLVGMVRGPSRYHPLRNAERALARRNVILDVMRESNLLTGTEHQTARTAPLSARGESKAKTRSYAAFLDLVKRQLAVEYAQTDLQSAGLRIFSTLDPIVQTRVQNVVTSELAELERKHTKARSLQAAAIVLDPRTGDMVAMVPGRYPSGSGFNRAVDAKRPIGSLMKPFIYLAALAQSQQYNLATRIDDAEVKLELDNGEIWQPQNYDGELHGSVPLYMALAKSFNLAAVQLGIDIGVEHVLKRVKSAGFSRRIKPFPATLLGAVDMSVLDVATIYQPLANYGIRVAPRTIRAVTTNDGAPLNRYEIELGRAFPELPTYLLRFALEQTVTRGTARGARSGLTSSLPLAGKTGTTNDLRDSWFAGFGSNRLGVVWVGRDDNKPARLTGASGALKVWARVMQEIGIQALAREPSPAIWAPVNLNLTEAARVPEHCTDVFWMPFDADALPPLANDCSGTTNVREQVREGTSVPWWRRLNRLLQ